MSRDASSADGATAVTPSDSTELSNVRALYVGVAGDLAVVMKNGGAAVTFKNAPIGTLPIRVTKVMATNTTATNILALT